MPLQPLLLTSSMEEISNLITTINNIPENMLNTAALRTWDNKFSIQWNLLQDLINQVSQKTLDSVLDSWFSILFAASSPLVLSEAKISFLSTICSGFLGWTDEEYFNTMVSMVCSEMLEVNYWHLLETLYIPVCITLNDGDDHWILLRVVIGEQQSYIEIYDSLEETLDIKGQQVYILILPIHKLLTGSSKQSNS
jgi:hypothetical protein